MKRYWQFLLVGVICLLVALLWAQPSQQAPKRPAVVATAQTTSTTSPASGVHPADAARAKNGNGNANNEGDGALPGSSSSLPLLAVIGFGVLAGGITSALRTR